MRSFDFVGWLAFGSACFMALTWFMLEEYNHLAVGLCALLLAVEVLLLRKHIK